MNYKKKNHVRRGFPRLLFLWFSISVFLIAPSAEAKMLSSIDSGSETELDATGGTRANEQVDGESFYIPGMYIAGKGSIQAGNMTSKGFKLRTGQDNGRVVFTVNFPYTITDVVIEGIANYEAKGDGACISVTKVEVDGVEVSFNGGQFPPKGAGYSESLILSGIQAKETIAIYFDNSNTLGTQINMSYFINWERPNASEPAIKVYPKTLGLIVGESYKASVKIAPKTFSTHWYSDNEEVATIDEDGNVYALASGKANIIHAWNDDVQVGDTTFLQVTNIGVLTPYIVKEYDFTSMDDITLTISDEQVGYFYMPGYYSFTPVYACTNNGLEDLAIQQPLDEEGRSGWSIVGGSGLYMGSSSDESAAICNLKAGQIVDIVYTGSELFLGTYEGEAKKKNINESVGRAIFQMEEDGMIAFGLTRGSYVKSITIYEKKILTLANLTYTLPDTDILYDGERHGAIVAGWNEMGTPHIYYDDSEGVRTEDAPSQPGTYTISFEFEESDLYYATVFPNVGKFTIYRLNTEEYDVLQSAYQGLCNGSEWKNKWDFSTGITGAKNLFGVTFKEGHVVSIALDSNNISGAFPYALLALPNLQQIDLSNNNLSGDIGLATYAFAQQNPTMMTHVRQLNISGNKFSGNIGLFANCFAGLTSLDASDNCLEDVFPIIPSTVTTLDLSKQTIARVVPLHLSNLSVDSIATKVPSILLYDHANQTFTTNINLLCTTPDNTWGMTMAYQNGQLSIPYVSEQNTYYGESGDTLNVAVLNNNGSREGSTFRIKLSFDEGDGNFDGQVNILDLQTNILYIMEKYQTRPYNFTAANLWKDDQINVQDVICQVNLLMSDEATESGGQSANARRNVPASTSASDAAVYVQDRRLMLSTSIPVAAFHIVVNGANTMSVAKNLEQAGMTITTKALRDGVHIIGYSFSNACIPAGISSIGTFDDEASVRNAMLSDIEANAVCVSFGGTVTGISQIGNGEQNVAVYDMQGRKVNTISHKGIYIQNGRKVVK